MVLKFTNEEGKLMEFELGPKPVTIGRSTEADIVIPSERISRFHCAIRLWDRDYVLKDLRSRNGTFLNDKKFEVAVIRPGDRIRIGPIQIHVERKSSKGTTTILREVGNEMQEGKGYRTILREIVKSTGKPPKAESSPEA